MSTDQVDQRPWVPGFRDLYPVDSYGVTDNEDPPDNMSFLQRVINEINTQGAAGQQATGSGRVYFPFYTGNTVQFSGSLLIGTAGSSGPNSCVYFTGSRGQLMAKMDDTDFFLVNNSGTGGGNAFNLSFEEMWIGGGINGNGVSNAAAIAFHFARINSVGGGQEQLVRHNYISGMAGVKCENVLQMRAIWNTVYQRQSTTPFAFYVGAQGGNRSNQCWLVGNCALGNGNNQGTAAFVIGGSDGTRIAVSQAQGYPNAYLIQPEAAASNIFKWTIFESDANAFNDGVLIITTPTNGWINGGVICGLNSQGGNGSATFGSAMKVSLGLGSSTQTPATQISGITFLANDCWNSFKAGYEFNTGSQLRVIGGQASSNTNAGIWCNGPVADLTCIGVDLSAKYQLGKGSNPAQSSAILVDNSLAAGAPGVLMFVGCPMNGYGTFASIINAVVQPTSMRAIACPGYNDQKHAISTASILTTGTTAAANNYFGFSRYEWNGNTGTITVNAGIAHTEASGSLWLDPYDVIKSTVAPTNQSWTGY